jgi:hypothetical protein
MLNAKFRNFYNYNEYNLLIKLKVSKLKVSDLIISLLPTAFDAVINYRRLIYLLFHSTRLYLF